jgi:hypothetical protein
LFRAILSFLQTLLLAPLFLALLRRGLPLGLGGFFRLDRGDELLGGRTGGHKRR